jgi:hypothetical protein
MIAAKVPTPRGAMTILAVSTGRSLITCSDGVISEHQRQPRQEVLAAEQDRPQQRRTRREQLHHELIQTQTRQDRLDDDLPRREPVLFLATVQHQLQRADGG